MAWCLKKNDLSDFCRILWLVAIFSYDHLMKNIWRSYKKLRIILGTFENWALEQQSSGTAHKRQELVMSNSQIYVNQFVLKKEVKFSIYIQSVSFFHRKRVDMLTIYHVQLVFCNLLLTVAAIWYSHTGWRTKKTTSQWPLGKQGARYFTR